MLAISYNWWKFLHVAGVIAFVLFHGVSMVAALQVRRERDRGRIATLLQFSGSSLLGMYVSLAWLTVFGVVAGIQGQYWNDGWFWMSIVLLVLVSAEMGAVSRPYYARLERGDRGPALGRSAPERRGARGDPARAGRRLERGRRLRRARGDHLAHDLQAVPGDLSLLRVERRPHNVVRSSGCSAGPLTTSPVGENRDP